MRKLFQLIGKNFKLLIRSKTSALIILIGPLLIMLLAGLAFNNTNTYSINIGIFSDSYTNLTDSFIDNLKTEQFRVSKTIDEGSCINNVMEGQSHVCIVFPPNISLGNAQDSLVFHVDYSKINLVWMIKDTISSSLSESASRLSLNLTSSLLDVLVNTEIELSDKKEVIDGLIGLNDEMGSDVDSLKEKLETMDLSFTDSDFSTSEISSSNSEMDSLFDSLETDSIEIINHIFDLLDDLETEINDLNISQSEMDSILSLKDNVENNATSLINTITDSNNLSISVSDDLVSLINSLSQNLAELKSRLSTSASSKSLSLDKVVSLKDGLDSSSSDLVSLKDSIDNVKNSLLTISLRNAEDIVNPLITEIKPVVTQRSHLNYFFPSLIALVIMFIAVLLASSLVMMEKTSRASFRNNITPTNGLIFFFSTYITCMIIMVFQLSILFMISILAFNLPLSIFSTNFLTILSLLLLISTVFIIFGMFIGYLFKSRETSTLGAVSLSSIFFIISDLIIPIESMPEHVLQFAKFNPFMISSNLLRNSILFNKSIFSLGSGFITLLIYIIVLFIVSLLLMKFFRNQHLLKLHLPRRKKK